MSHLIIIFLALLLMLSYNSVISQEQTGGDTLPCNEVINELSPCLSYLNKQYSSPSSFCCQGANYVWKQYGKKKKQRRGVCECLESVLPLIGQIDGSVISAIPQQCGLKIKIPPINGDFNCSM